MDNMKVIIRFETLVHAVYSQQDSKKGCWLKKVKQPNGEQKIATGILLPHNLAEYQKSRPDAVYLGAVKEVLCENQEELEITKCFIEMIEAANAK